MLVIDIEIFDGDDDDVYIFIVQEGREEYMVGI